MKIAIKDIKPNPFRNIDHYPISRDKVEALKVSFSKTGLWPNIMGRLNKKGEVEIPFAHHRKVALIEFYGPTHKIEVPILELTDTDMIVMMASENMQEWGTDATVELETVSAVVKAYAEGKIQLNKSADDQGVKRFAPSFLPQKRSSPALENYPYSAKTISDLLGWSPQKVGQSLAALQFIEEGILTLSDFVGQSSTQIATVVTEARRARARDEEVARKADEIAKEARREEERARREEEKAKVDAEKYRQQRERAGTEERRKEREQQAKEAERLQREAAKKRLRREQDAQRAEEEALQKRLQGAQNASKVGQAVLDHLKAGGGTRGARDVAAKVTPRQKAPPVNISRYLESMLSEIGNFMSPDDKLTSRIDAILEYKSDIDEVDLEAAEQVLRSLIRRATQYADRFHPGPTSTTKVVTGTERNSQSLLPR